ncbi:MAG: DUF2179 domain-containing protein [Clostridiaceae bacterium]
MNEIVLILVLQLIYVPLLTLRTLCMVKKLTVLTTIFGMLEALIYVFGLSIVLSGEQSIVEMLVYAAGFSIGLAIGIQVEKKLAIGYTSVMVNISKKDDKMIEFLRSQGFGVTIFEGQGRASNRYRLDILAKKNRELELYRYVDQFEPNAFITSMEPTRFQGGYLTGIMKKNHILFKNGLKTSKNSNIDIQSDLDEDKSWVEKTTDELLYEIKEFPNKDKTLYK